MYYMSTQIQSKTKTAVMRLSPELKERYETLARHTDRPASYYMRLAMEEKIAEYEHIYDSVPETAAKTRYQPELLAHGRYQHIHAVRLEFSHASNTNACGPPSWVKSRV